MSATATQGVRMFSDEAWDAGWKKAQSLGLAEIFEPRMRPMTRRDVEEIVSAVVNNGFEELYVDQVLAEAAAESVQPDAMDRLREHMRTRLAIEAIRNDCVMLTLPREITDHPEQGLVRIRLIVPVRRLA